MDNSMFKDRRITVFSFTRTGTELGRKLCNMLRAAGRECRGYAPEKYAGEGILPFLKNRARQIGSGWGKDAFLFIGAAGIAVRWIAPWVSDKFTDSPVLVLDEKGRYVIPLLSGHIGGAVLLADEIGTLIGAVPVHTTATDVQGKFAVDVFAGKNGLLITDRKKAREISAAVLEGEKIACYIKYPGYQVLGTVPENISICSNFTQTKTYRCRIIIGDNTGQSKEEPDVSPFYTEAAQEESTLLLKPKNIVAGIGCRKGISERLLEEELRKILKLHGLEIRQLERIASIDLKREEKALLELSEKYGIPFLTYSADELGRIQSVTSGSEFVKNVTGVDNVCERAALLCCGNGILLQEKCIRPAMTVALARRPLEIRF